MFCAMPTMAHLAQVYAIPVRPPRNPAIDDMNSITPAFFLNIPGTAARDSSKAECRWTLRTLFHVSGVISSRAAPPSEIPALIDKMSESLMRCASRVRSVVTERSAATVT